MILAGVTIATLTGEGGILNKAKTAEMSQEEQEAKEKLELVLQDLTISKHTDPTYDQDKYINDAIEKENMTIVGDIVIVDGWQFEIDRSVPKIGMSLGKGTENKEMELTASATVTTDYVKANLEANLTFSGKIKEIFVKGEKVEVPTPENGVYHITQEIRENGSYTVLVKDEQGSYKMAKVEVTEDMDIWNKADMEKFRDKVNEGRTFEGRTARVMADIDLEGSEENKWIPIGNYASNTSLIFKGTFEGNGHTIQGVYINSTAERQGLFGQNAGTIKNITVSGSIQSTTKYTGGITGANDGKIEQCVNQATITGNERVGGISGDGYGEINNCKNEGVITGTLYTGGIAGVCWTNGKIEECINNGTVIGNDLTGGIVGILAGSIKDCSNQKKVVGKYQYTGGIVGDNQGEITQCSNTAEIQGYSRTGGITGQNKKTISLSFNTAKITSSNVCCGGIAGSSLDGTTISNVYNRETIECNHAVGGIVGEEVGKVKVSYSYNTGYVTLTSAVNNLYAHGGIVGYAPAGSTCEFSYNVGNVYGNGNVGGIVGENRGTVTYCYNSGGYTSTKKANSYLGPITGYNGGSVSNTQSSGTMPTIYSVMSRNNNTNWINNTDSSINGGYPIFRWQQEKEENKES